MTLLNPAYKLTIGDKIVDTTNDPQASTLTDLLVLLDMDAPADYFRLVLGQVDGLNPNPEDDAAIELGYADDDSELFQVITGTITDAEPGLTWHRIIGHSNADILLHSHTNQTYESKSAGDIVRDLANRAGVNTASIEDGIRFPAYVIDGRRNVYQHMRELSDQCGFDVYINSDGELVFKRFSGGETIHLFDYAKHILELDLQHQRPAADSVEAFGESPASSASDEAWGWLTKDFSGSKGVAGNGVAVQLLQRPALRTAAAAQTAAAAALTGLQRRSLRGQLLTTGRPQIRLGDAIRIREAPDDAFNSTFQVRQVMHRLRKIDGFTTLIGFRSLNTGLQP